ncbi:MAG TPA: hypothetical protein VGI45_13775, partial [Terracidiphilus sp.]
MSHSPDELDGAFIPPFDYADLLWASELFVGRDALQRVPKRPGGERSDSNRVVALDAILGPQLQAKARFVGGSRNTSVKRKELIRAYQNLLL